MCAFWKTGEVVKGRSIEPSPEAVHFLYFLINTVSNQEVHKIQRKPLRGDAQFLAPVSRNCQ